MNNLRPIFAALENIKHGSIEIELPNQASKKFSSQIKEPQAHLKIKDLAKASRFILLSIVASEMPRPVTITGQMITQEIVLIKAKRMSGS